MQVEEFNTLNVGDMHVIDINLSSFSDSELSELRDLMTSVLLRLQSIVDICNLVCYVFDELNSMRNCVIVNARHG